MEKLDKTSLRDLCNMYYACPAGLIFKMKETTGKVAKYEG